VSMKSVAIIGGGITGLTAAFNLQQRGVPVTLYEGSERIGGVIRTIHEDGYLAECGPNTILETSPLIGQLIRDVDLESRQLYTDPAAEKRFLVRNKKLIELPVSPLAFIGSRLFSWRAKASLLAEPFRKRAAGDLEESLADFVRRRLGVEFLDYAINPFVAGVYAGDPERLSVKHAFAKLYDLEQRYGSLIGGQIFGARERKRRGAISKQNAKKISFDKGLQVLTDRLSEKLGEQVRLNHSVKRITSDPEGWSIDFENAGITTTSTHSSVLLALPAFRLADLELHCKNKPVDMSLLGQIEYPPVTSVVLGFKRQDISHPLDGFGVLIPEVEGFNSLGSIFSSSLFPGRCPVGHLTFTSYIGGARSPELALKEKDEIVRLVMEDLRVLVGLSGKPTYTHCFCWPRAIPQYNVGYGKFKMLMEETEKRAAGLFIGGHCRDGISLGDSIISGYNAAARIENYIKST
jgi:oxygen-dependent protoporphyrinogen oxidase